MKFYRTAFALCLLALVAGVAVGQVTSGSLNGQVQDQEGGALPGVTIQAVNESTATSYTVVTGPDGRFTIVNARLGDYTVTASLEGFRTGETSGVTVRLGETTSLQFELQLETISEELLVVGESNPLISPERTGAASNVSTESIESLPTISRGFEDFARTNPFFVVSSQNENPNNVSIAGRNARYNNITIDGSVNNDLFGLADTGTPGGQAGTTPISLDAIQELQLVLADYDVRQGGFSSGSINAVTRSGTNQFKGSVFAYTRDQDYFGDGGDELGKIGEFSEDQYGFRVGGPVIQDKMFFFVNMDLEDRSTPTGFSIDGASGQQMRIFDPAIGATRDVTAEGERFRDILTSQYGFDPGGLAQNSRKNPSDKYFARLDFNVGDSNTLTLRHNYVDAANDVNRPSSTFYEFPSETYAFTDKTNSTVAQLNSVLGSSSFNEARIAYQTIKDRRSGAGGVRFPHIQVANVIPNSGGVFEAGTEQFSTANSLDQTNLEITNNFTMVRGNHTITLGTHNELFGFENLFIRDFFGSYVFQDLDALEAGTARQFDHSFPNPGQPDRAKFDVNQIGLYAGDQWAARPNLTLTYGVRVDVPFFPDTPGRNPLTEELFGYRTDKIPDGEQLWQPRVGFNWDPKSDGTQQLRGGLGVFAGRTPYVWISNQYTNNGLVLQRIRQTGSVAFNPDPDNQPTEIPGASVFAQEINVIDPNFKFPTVLRFNLGYDRQLPWWDLVGTIEVVRSDSQKEIDYKDVNLVQTGETTLGGRPLYTRVSTDFTGAYLITNSSKGEATNVALKIEKPYRDGFSGFVSYAYGDSKSVNDGTSSQAVSNWRFNPAFDPNNAEESTSQFRVKHRFNASVSYQFNRETRWPTTASLFYNLQAGRPYSYLMASDFVTFGFGRSYNGDGFGDNDLLFVPATANDVEIVGGGTWEQLDAFINANKVLDKNRGGFVSRNADQAPWYHTLDLHLAQQIPVSRTSLEVTLDLQNLGNLFDSSSGLLKYVPFSTVTPVEIEGFTEDGRPRYSLRSVVTDPDNNSIYAIHNIESRWRAKLGLRWNF